VLAGAALVADADVLLWQATTQAAKGAAQLSMLPDGGLVRHALDAVLQPQLLLGLMQPKY